MGILNEVVWPKFKGQSRSIRVKVEMSVGFYTSVTCVAACTEAVVGLVVRLRLRLRLKALVEVQAEVGYWFCLFVWFRKTSERGLDGDGA